MQIWVTSIATFRERFIDFRSCWVVFIHIVRGVPVVSSSSPRGKLSDMLILSNFWEFNSQLTTTDWVRSEVKLSVDSVTVSLHSLTVKLNQHLAVCKRLQFSFMNYWLTISTAHPHLTRNKLWSTDPVFSWQCSGSWLSMTWCTANKHTTTYHTVIHWLTTAFHRLTTQL